MTLAQVSPTRDWQRLALGAEPIRRAIYLAGMMPALWYAYLIATEQIGADPLNILERGLGLWALRFLILSLAITPLRRLGGPSLIRFRRAIGLLAFYYAALHVAVYLLLDQSLDIPAIVADILKRPYITVGMLAFTILIPLAITSNGPMIRRLGSVAWNRLHKLVYIAAIAAALHFVMLVKTWQTEPLVYAAITATLLLFRLGIALRKRFAPADARRSARANISGVSPRH